ncbi:hypothetical protein C8R45DRAFT_1102762 [Mycena sanguinolenta]|nr:hypothetical protein C8R45DRAFT_1102762 [Mycena sanguinolenta]
MSSVAGGGSTTLPLSAVAYRIAVTSRRHLSSARSAPPRPSPYAYQDRDAGIGGAGPSSNDRLPGSAIVIRYLQNAAVEAYDFSRTRPSSFSVKAVPSVTIVERTPRCS